MLAGALALAPAAAAAPGDLDPSFSGDGRLTIERGSHTGVAVVRRDGEIVVAGCAGPRDPRIIVRISPSGDFLGKTGSADGFGCATDARLARGGRILLSGFGPEGGCVVARLTREGELDRSFAGDGIRPIRFADGRSFRFCPAIAADRAGRVVVLGDDGRGPGGHHYHFAVARLRAGGTFDRSFSGDGRAVGRFRRAGRTASPRDVALGGDGRVVVAGKAGTFAVARLTPRGVPDRTFSFDGRRLIGPRSIGGANAVAIQADGKLVLAGETFKGNSERFRRLAVYRLTPRGDLDHSFGEAGRVYGHLGGDEVVHDTAASLALEDDGRIILAGASMIQGGTYDFGVARLTPAGLPDETFSGDSHLAVGFEGSAGPDGGDHAERVATTPDGRIVVVGISEPGMSIARLLGE